MSTESGAMNFCATSTSAGITDSTSRVRRVWAVEARALSAVLPRSRRVSERFANAVETPPPARRCRRSTAANIVNSASRTRSHALWSTTSTSSPASIPSHTPRSTGSIGCGASSTTTESASRAGTPAPASRTIWSTTSGNCLMNAASWRVWSSPSVYQAPPAPASTSAGIVHQPSGALRNHRANQVAPAAPAPAPSAADSAGPGSSSG